MDSLSQIVLGASLAAAIAPAQNRRAALLAGTFLGTLPDLDVFPLQLVTQNPILLMTLHRGPTHSLLVLPLIGWAIWWVCKRRGHRVKASPVRWFWAIQAALITHPLLDAFTVYGTQLLWPFTPHPAMWSSLFIIDPLYTIWLLLGCAVALIAGPRRIAQTALVAGLALSTLYIGWSLYAKSLADKAAQQTLAELGYPDVPYFSVPTPFNTLLWRSVALTPDGFFEGERSVIADTGPMQLHFYPSDTTALQAVSTQPDVARLLWFSSGFIKAQALPVPDAPAATTGRQPNVAALPATIRSRPDADVFATPDATPGKQPDADVFATPDATPVRQPNADASPPPAATANRQPGNPAPLPNHSESHDTASGQRVAAQTESGSQRELLVLSDLRMGAEPEYGFNFAVAERASPDAPWQPIETQRVPRQTRGWWSFETLWKRIWTAPQP